MTVKEIEKILLYHNRGGFAGDLKDLNEQIEDLRASNSEISSFSFKLAIPANRNNASTVEICVMKNSSLLDLEVQAKEMTRFIERLDEAIENLDEMEKKVIKSRYFNLNNCKKEFQYVAAEVHYSEKWCRTLNSCALRNIQEELHGVKVTWDD